MKQRTISAVIFLTILISLLIMGGTLFKIFVLAIALLGFKELLDIRESKYPLPLLVKLLAFGVYIYIIVSNVKASDTIYFLDYRIIALTILVLLIPIVMYKDSKVYNINDGLFLIGSVLLLGLSFNLLCVLRDYDLAYVVYLFSVTMITDTYAYFAGCLIGKNKLIEEISPKKTWEGLIIGTAFGVLISSVFYYIFINDSVNVVYLILCTTVLSLLGQLGDLTFSSIKRLYNKKDFSNIIPGHGGVLDRLDSFTFVILGYVLFMFLI